MWISKIDGTDFIDLCSMTAQVMESVVLGTLETHYNRYNGRVEAVRRPKVMIETFISQLKHRKVLTKIVL